MTHPARIIRPLRLTGRCADGAERGAESLFHAVPDTPEGCRGYRALCGAKYGRMSAGWSEPPGEAVTCRRCLKRMGSA